MTASQEAKACRFISGHPGFDPDWSYCGAKIAEIGATPGTGSHGVYCAEHLKKMYLPPGKRAKDETNFTDLKAAKRR